MILKILLVLGILVIAGFLFVLLWPAFGGRASKEDREDYAKRAHNYKNGKFYNESASKRSENEKKETKEIVVSTKGDVPKSALPTIVPKLLSNPSVRDVTVTWLGHSSLLLQMHGKNILFDPIFSKRSSPVPFYGPKRFTEVPIKMKDLPHIDVVILSHDHFDHLDYKTILGIDAKVGTYIVPLGVENDLERFGVDPGKIKNMAWWEEINLDGLMISCTPARHYSKRSFFDRYKSLWASWVLRDEFYQIYNSSDSGFGQHFQEIREKYGEFDFAFFDSGQYDAKWPVDHMSPDESYRAAMILTTKIAMPIHWGAFKLSNHAWDDPAVRFLKAVKKKKIEVVTPKIGETMDMKNYTDFMDRWWERIE